jgi:MOSC domain-containing protein YiiM
MPQRVGAGLASDGILGYSQPMTVVSLRVGMPRTEVRRSKELLTGGAKTPVTSAMLRFAGFEGDGVADHVHHGGADRAVCVYPAGHYAWWKSEHGYDLPFGGFSENLTVEGVREEELCIGDIVRIGAALAQVTLPRDPCLTIDRLTEIVSLHRLARESGRCGFHMRTLEEGMVHVEDRFEIVERNSAAVSVAVALDLYHGRSADRELVHVLQSMPEFADEGKRELAKRIG